MVALAVVVVVFQEEVLVGAVAGERNGRDTEAREDVLESVHSAEGASVSPGLISGPGIPLSVNRPRRSGGLELVHVETGGVVGRHGVDGDCVAGRESIGDK